MRATLRIAWIAMRELFYERVFYLLMVFAVGSLGISLMLGQLTYSEQTKLTLDFMLGAMQLSMVLFSIFMGISLFHRELVLGSVSMILSKPISRTSFLLGKYFGQLTVQAIVTFAMAAMTYLLAGRVNGAAIFQTALLVFFEASCLTAITFFFAVNAGSVTAAIAALCLFGVGHLRSSLANTATDNVEVGMWSVLKGLVPDLEVFNMKDLASYGFSLPASEVGWIFLYAVCCVAFFLVMASLTFQRRDILT